jgi:peptidoglycan/xylan/chitin deacetylase (PgdA/CDA1 family)
MIRRNCWTGLGLAVALIASATLAHAEQHWIVPEPTLAHVTQPWREGALRDRSEDGRAFVEIETDGRGHPTLAAVTSIAPAADARRRFVSLTLRVHGMKHLSHLEVRLGSDALAKSWYALSVPIYGDGEYNFLQDGAWTTVTLSLGGAETQGSPDREHIDSLALMVTDDGKDKVRVDFGGAALVDAPKQGVVSFTFDDGYKEHLWSARLLAERKWRGTYYVIPQLIGEPLYLTKEQLDEIGKLGMDVASHDDPPFTQVPAKELEPRIRGIREKLSAWGFAEGAQHLAYPLGKQEPTRVRPTIAKVFTTARLAGSGPETLPPADPQLLRASNVMNTTTPEEVGAWARRARDEGEWLILMFHWLPEKAAQGTDYSMDDYRRALEEVAKTKVRVAPVTEVWREVADEVAAQTKFPPRTESPAKRAP